MENNIRVACLTRAPKGYASSRYRAYQFIEPLKKYGIDLQVTSLYPEWLYSVRKSKAHGMLANVLTAAVSLIRTMIFFIFALRADVVLIIRDAAPFSLDRILKILKRLDKPIVFDFDDAIYLKSNRVESYVRLADVVTVGNKVLAGWAEKSNSKVILMPTVLDVREIQRPTGVSKNNLVIGWIGSPATAPYLEALRGVFEKISVDYSAEIHLIGGEISGVAADIDIIDWSEENENREISLFDIGIAPLPDDEWARGKCGFKILQYMAQGLPTVASPVGANEDIIRHGGNGFLARTEAEWTYFLSLLVTNEELRKTMGRKARLMVEEEYSLVSASHKMATIFRALCGDGRASERINKLDC